MIVRRTDHKTLALSRMLETTRKPFLGALLLARIGGLQRAENGIWNVADAFNIDNGTGFILDWIGKIVGRGRNGQTDAAYRVSLRTQILINRSDGTYADMLGVGNASISGLEAITMFSDRPPGSLDVAAEDVADPVGLFSNLNQSRAAGIALQFTFGDSTDRFRMSATYPGSSSVGGSLGFGTVLDTHYGGRLGAMFAV